ncbi:MAG: hypothetical protein ACTHMI_10840 [Mucilaginibacter sp.]
MTTQKPAYLFDFSAIALNLAPFNPRVLLKEGKANRPYRTSGNIG